MSVGPTKKRGAAKANLVGAEAYKARFEQMQFSLVALPDGRAVTRVFVAGPTPAEAFAHTRLRVLKGGEAFDLPGDPTLDAGGDRFALLRVDDGVANVTPSALVLYPQLAPDAPARVLPIQNPITTGRKPYRAWQVPAARSALVLLTQERSSVHTDGLCYLDWDDDTARWREVVTLSWDDIPHQPQWADFKVQPPYLWDAMVASSGQVIAHHTGRRLYGGGGSVSCMDWSMLVEIEATTGRSRPIAEIATGIGKFTDDSTRLTLMALRTDKIDWYGLDGESQSSVRVKPHAEGKEEPWYAGAHGNSVWLWLGNERLRRFDLGTQLAV